MIYDVDSAAEDFKKVMGINPEGYYCPIMCEVFKPSEVIGGHIINDAIKSAPRRRVPVSNQVDHFFGSDYEPDLINYMNLRKANRSEMIKMSCDLRIEGSGGKSWSVAPVPKGSDPPFPIFDINYDDPKNGAKDFFINPHFPYDFLKRCNGMRVSPVY